MLSGNLAELPLLGLLQSLMGAARSGALVIELPRLAGRVYLEAGHPVHAEAGRLRGLDALELLSGVRRATFRFQADTPPPARTLEPGLRTQNLILHQFEAWEELQLPGDWSATLKSLPLSGRTQLSPGELALVSLAEGKTLGEVLASGRGSPLETAQTLERLIGQGLLEARAALHLEPLNLVVLSLYGSEEGVAAVDEELFAEWRGLLGPGLQARVRSKTFEATLRVQPRANIPGRLGLFEPDLRRLKVGRGAVVEVAPEAL